MELCLFNLTKRDPMQTQVSILLTFSKDFVNNIKWEKGDRVKNGEMIFPHYL
jgi:hypothetical protein